MRGLLTTGRRAGFATIATIALLALIPLSAKAHSGPHEQAQSGSHQHPHDQYHTNDSRSPSVASAPSHCPAGPGNSCYCVRAYAVGSPIPAIADAAVSPLSIQLPPPLASWSCSAERALVSPYLLASSPPRAPPLLD